LTGKNWRLFVVHNNKWSIIDFEKCIPFICDPISGECSAVRACSKELLIQEEPGEMPMLLSQAFCVGCGKCVAACNLQAIYIERGI